MKCHCGTQLIQVDIGEMIHDNILYTRWRCGNCGYTFLSDVIYGGMEGMVLQKAINKAKRLRGDLQTATKICDKALCSAEQLYDGLTALAGKDSQTKEDT